MDTTGLTSIEQHLLDLIQTRFPLTTRPYTELGKAVGLTEDETIALLHSLKERRILRQISAIFQGTALGFMSALISFHVLDHQLEDTAALINTHPGVSHNYQRNHRWNLWFTLSVPDNLDLLAHVRILAERTGCQQYLYLPGVRTFKRRVQFALSSQPEHQLATQSSEFSPKLSRKITLPIEIQRGIMAELQRDLPLTPTPFLDLARQFEIDEATLFEFMAALQANHTMSRFAGMLRHRSVGFTANVMVVWNVPSDRLAEVAEYASASSAISHCYERVTYPEWPYNLYTMIHGTSREGCQDVIADLSAHCAVQAYEQLDSVKEFKKQAVNYFDNRIAEWHAQQIIAREITIASGRSSTGVA